MFKYRIHWADGTEAGEAEYAVNIHPGELVWIRDPYRQVRVLDLIETEPEDESPYDGLLRVEAT